MSSEFCLRAAYEQEFQKIRLRSQEFLSLQINLSLIHAQGTEICQRQLRFSRSTLKRNEQKRRLIFCRTH